MIFVVVVLVKYQNVYNFIFAVDLHVAYLFLYFTLTYY